MVAGGRLNGQRGGWPVVNRLPPRYLISSFDIS